MITDIEELHAYILTHCDDCNDDFCVENTTQELRNQYATKYGCICGCDCSCCCEHSTCMEE